MRFIYAPEGVEKRVWEFEPGKIMSPEGEAIERHTGMLFDEWQEKVQQGSMAAIHALLYVLLKREKPTLKYDQVQFSFSEIDWDYSDAEAWDAIDAAEAIVAGGEELTPGQAVAYEQLVKNFGKRPVAEDDAPVAPVDEQVPPAPKEVDLSKPYALSTSSTS